MILFLGFILFFFVIIQVNVIALVFSEIGIPSHYVFAALFATLFGSFINIPAFNFPVAVWSWRAGSVFTGSGG